MNITVLGGCGAWPTADHACSGYLVEHQGFRLLVDPGYATLPRLLGHTAAEDVDAVLAAGGRALAYTGDTGPSEDIVVMARDADVLLAEATFAEEMAAGHDPRYLSTARQAGEHAARAGVGRLVLTHLWPGTDHSAPREAARRAYAGDLAVAAPGLTVDLG